MYVDRVHQLDEPSHHHIAIAPVLYPANRFNDRMTILLMQQLHHFYFLRLILHGLRYVSFFPLLNASIFVHFVARSFLDQAAARGTVFRFSKTPCQHASK